jgi:hypothetical protein
MPRFSPVAVERLDVALMIAACAAAWAAPFQVFLAAYVVLGPLHYLTELAWLRDRGWFTPVRADAAALAACAALASVPGFSPEARPYTAWTLSIGVFAASVLALRRATRGAWLAVAFLAGVLLLAGARPFQALVAAAFIPTFIHVLVFTGLFVLAGALKERRPAAAAGLLVYAVCVGACFLAPPGGAPAGPRAAAAFSAGGFPFVHAALYAVVFRSRLDPARLFVDPRSVAIARLTAFAYTYHYLNWFSKTTIIRWHEVGTRPLALCVAGWAAALAVHAWSFRWGLGALSLLSMLHVVMELPLDARAAVGVARGLAGRGAGEAYGA